VIANPRSELLEALARIEESIRASDTEAILARWEFGRQVLAQRVGKQLPPGLWEEICEHAKIGRQELSNRTRVADIYDKDELSSQLESSGANWTAIVAGLPKKRSTPKPLTEPRAVPARPSLVIWFWTWLVRFAERHRSRHTEPR
jgi:hypothetical protein